MPWQTRDLSPAIWHKLYVESLKTLNIRSSSSNRSDITSQTLLLLTQVFSVRGGTQGRRSGPVSLSPCWWRSPGQHISVIISDWQHSCDHFSILFISILLVIKVTVKCLDWIIRKDYYLLSTGPNCLWLLT